MNRLTEERTSEERTNEENNDMEEDQIFQKIKELVAIDFKKIKYTDVPHLLLVITKFVYEDQHLKDEKVKKDLIVKVVQLLIDKSEMDFVIKLAVKEMIPYLVDKYIEIDNGTVKIKIRTYGSVGSVWIKIRSYLDRKILDV